MFKIKVCRGGVMKLFLAVILGVFMSVAETGEADSSEEPGSVSAEDVSSEETEEKASGGSEELSAGLEEDGSETGKGSVSAEDVSSEETEEKASGDSEELSAGLEEDGSETEKGSASAEKELRVERKSSTSGTKLETKTVDGYTIEELEGKLISYSRMRKTGRSLLISGVSLLGAGGGIFALAMIDGAIPLALTGLIAFEVGIPLTIVGGVLGGIGRRKQRQYRQMLRVRVSPGSLELVYSF